MCNCGLNYLMRNDKQESYFCQKCGEVYAKKKLQPVIREDANELLRGMNELKNPQAYDREDIVGV